MTPPPANVLLSAYSCTPGRGSEPGVGFETVRAAATRHNVWVLTRLKNVEPLTAHFAENPGRGTVHIAGIDLSPRAMSLKKRLGPLGLYWYYDRWQQRAAAEMERLMSEVDIHLVHHVTFSSDWSRAGVAQTRAPFLWGPIGGGSRAPRSLLTSLGARGVISEALRISGRGLMRRRGWHTKAWESASMVLVQNRETAALAPPGRSTVILPHGTALLTDAPPAVAERTREILVVGRIIPWKGGRLALEAFRRVQDPTTTLHFLGTGPDLGRLQSAVAKLGLAERVRFEGALPRETVLHRIARAGALLHPAVHDESPITVGEALSLRTPVVCLDRGGPPELLACWPDSPGRAIEAADLRTTATRMAQAIDTFLADPEPPVETSVRPTPSYAERILDVYDRVIAG